MKIHFPTAFIFPPKFEMKKPISLFFLAILCMAIWLTEIIVRDWTGMDWLSYVHLSLIIMPVFIAAWVVWINGKFENKKHLLYYPVLSITYLLFLILFIAGYPEGFRYNSMMRGAGSSAITHYMSLLLFPFVTFLWNTLIARIELKKLSITNKLVLLFSPFFIPAISALFTMLLFTQSYLFPSTPPDPIQNGLEPIHWFKSGSLFFAVITYQGIYYLWLKGKIQFRFTDAIR